MKFQSVRGFKDWVPEEFIRYEHLIDLAKAILKKYNYQEVKIPILEKTELFIRSIGEVTDIVQKETYTFQDRNQEFLTLRPEATAGICRMVIENGLFMRPKPLKFFTIGPMFRHERPQKGRLREFYQIDVELFGNLTTWYEVELIKMGLKILYSPLKDLSEDEEIKNLFTLEINSLGCEKCRPNYKNYLLSSLKDSQNLLCNTCQQRLERNPFRILDCKNPNCQTEIQKLEPIHKFWCEDCELHFKELKELLEFLDLKYVLNPYLVRGLDYYTRTIFEIKGKGLGAQDTVCAGGRYDKLLEELGGPFLPAIGFAIGIERWELCISQYLNPQTFLERLSPQVFIALLGREQFNEGLKLAEALREADLKVEVLYEEKSLKALLREADKLSSKKVLILGEEEIKEGKVLLKDMLQGTQEKISLEKLIPKLKEEFIYP